MPYLEIKNISKEFGGLKAVNDVSFQVNQGEIVSIIGPNGAGKTTVLNMLTGIYDIDGGEVWFDGKPIHQDAPQKIVAAGISRTFQNIRLFKNLRVIENVLIGAHLHTKYSFFGGLFRTRHFRRMEQEQMRRAVEILESIGLKDHINSYADSLSYGDQRRLEIARAIATGAKILLLDEPAAGMNPQESEALMHFIRKLREEGYTIVLIEHDMKFVRNISDRIYVLDYGKKIAEGTPDEVLSDEQVIRAYLQGGTRGEAAC